jgi:hypothetical protein
MQAKSFDPGVHMVEPLVGGGNVEGWTCPGATLPPPNGGEEGRLVMECPDTDRGVEFGVFSPPEGITDP